MIQPKANFVDRVEQSIVILKNNLLPIAIPITIVNVFFLVIVPSLMARALPLEELASWDITQKLPLLFTLGTSLLLAYIIAYLFLLIPVQIAMLKSIKHSLAWEKVTLTQYLWYGFKTILQAFKTYWYIFLYVYIIPALLFIVWGLIFIISTMIWSDLQLAIMWLWWTIMGASLLVTIVFALYRWTKAQFWLVSAIDEEEFTKENFQHSLSLSDKKWWRVFWNLFWIWFIVGCVVNLVWFLIGIASIFSSDWTDIAEEIWESEQELNIQEVAAEFSQFRIGTFISDIFATGIWSILWTLIVVFAYILFMRLRQESEASSVSVKKEIEL